MPFQFAPHIDNYRQWILYLGLSTVVLSDLLMTATLCLLLSTRRSNIAMSDLLHENQTLFIANPHLWNI